MGFREKISKRLAETRETNRRIKFANRIIREKARTAGLKEKQEQAIRIAIEKQKLKANFKINRAKKINELKLKGIGQAKSNPFGNIWSSQSPIGNFGSSIISKQPTQKKVIRKKPKRKRKKTKTNRRRTITRQSTQSQRPKFDILGI